MMSWRRGLITAALVLACGGAARANYSFTVTPVLNTYNLGGTTLTLSGQSGTNLAADNTVNIANIGLLSSTISPATDPVNDSYTLTINVTNGVSMGSFVVQGTLSGAVNSTSSPLDNVFTSITPSSQNIGGTMITVNVGPLGTPDYFYGPPTINNGVGTGSLGAEIIVGAVPEPASMALVGLGAAVMLGYGRRRRANA